MSRVHDAVAMRYYIDELTIGRQLIFMLTFNILLIVSSYIQFPLPLSPVPVTAQTMIVMACGLFLGPIRGALIILAYLGEGAMGLPVFAGGTAGFAKLIGPTGGYLFGFILAALLVGFLSEKIRSMNYVKLIAVLSVGTIAVLLPGLAILNQFVPQGSLLQMGLYPFLPGAAIKIIIMASALSAFKKFRNTI